MSSEENELSYTNENGDTVFTAAYLKKKGTCCKSKCLHCPYGYTQKHYGIEVVEMELKHIQHANEIIADTMPVQMSAISMSLLEGAFGKKSQPKAQHVTMDNFTDFAFGQFKDTICGVIEFSNRLSESTAYRPVKEIFLKKEFQDQGLGIEHIVEK